MLGCRSPQGNNLLRGAYEKNKVKIKSKEIGPKYRQLKLW